MAAARLPTLLTTALVFLAVSSELLARSAADGDPAPMSGATCSRPPPSGTGQPGTPQQPFTPGMLPPPGQGDQPPSLVPPPPYSIIPYYSGNAAPSLLQGGRLWLAVAALYSSILAHLLLH